MEAVKDAKVERRMFVRMSVNVKDKDNWCTVRTGGGESATMLFKDINLGGCRFKFPDRGKSGCVAQLSPGDVIEILDCGLEKWSPLLREMRATIVWTQEEEVGCCFEKLIQPASFMD